MPYGCEVFSLAVVIGTVLHPVWALGIVPSNPVGWFLYTQLLFPHTLVLISILPEYLMGIFIAALSSQVLRPMNSSHLGFAGLSAPILKSGNPLSFAWILLPMPFWKYKRWQTAAFIGLTLSGFHLSEIMVFHCLIPGI